MNTPRHPNAPHLEPLNTPFRPTIPFSPSLPWTAKDAGRKIEEALSLVRPVIKDATGTELGGLAKKTALRLVLWGLNKLLKGAATEDDVKDLVTGVSGIVGFTKRRFATGSTARDVLERADSILDAAHKQLGEAQH